jgi:hypothetical protein
VTIPYSLLLTSRIYPWQVEHTRDKSTFLNSDTSYFRLVWGKERGTVTGMFYFSEVKNMKLSLVYSICQKLRTRNCREYIRFVRFVRGKAHGIVTGMFNLSLEYSVCQKKRKWNYFWQIEHTLDNSIFFTQDKSNIPVTITCYLLQTSWIYPWQFHILYPRQDEHTRDHSMFFTSDKSNIPLSGVKNMELSLVYSICQK